MGYTCDAMANYMALVGWSVPNGMDEKFTLEEAGEVFSFERVNKAGAKFDWDKLRWFNSQVIQAWDPEQLFNEIKPLLIKQVWKLPEKEWCL